MAFQLKRRIIAVDPSMHTPEFDCFNGIARQSSLPIELHMPALFNRELPQLDSKNHDQTAAIIVMGSAASVYDSMPWQHRLETFVANAADLKIPILGICYGHQLLAKVFGGQVGFLFPDKTKLRGVYEIEFANSRLWPHGKHKLVRSHCEHVTKVPGQFNVIATSREVSVDAMEHNQLPIWGIQTHPEADAEFLSEAGITLDPQCCWPYGHGTQIVQRFLDFAAS